MKKIGGVVTLQRYGNAHFAKIGRLGGVAVLNKYGAAYFSKLGKKGGIHAQNKAFRETPYENQANYFDSEDLPL